VRVAIPVYVEADPLKEGYKTIYTVPPGATLTVERVVVHFPSGTGGELLVAFYYGQTRVFPEGEGYRGDGTRLEDEVSAVWISGEDVVVWFRNLSSTDVRRAYGKLEGELKY